MRYSTKMKATNPLIKIALAIFLFVCVLDMPYGYYQFVRFVAFVIFGVFAYETREVEPKIELFIYIGLALLFQPFFKIALGRELWNIVDVIVGLGLILSVFRVNSKR
ncbi:DUF6804 family protein [Lacinutrix undariae]